MHSIILFRHGIAEEHESAAEAGREDAERRLTQEGRARTKEAAMGLLSLVPQLDLALTSPYIRARDTAALLAKRFPEASLEETDALRPGSDAVAVLGRVAATPEASTVALVGHEPDLGMIGSWLMTGERAYMLEVKKASAILLRCEGAPEPGEFELVWSLPPRVLRAMAGR